MNDCKSYQIRVKLQVHWKQVDVNIKLSFTV